MNDEIPWHYVAMIFIAFASWVYGRLKEAAEIRRARAAAKQAKQDARNRAQPAPPPSPYRPTAPAERPTVVAPAPVVPPAPAAEIEVPKTFRELFEMLQEQAAAPAPVQRGEARPPAPPPLPVASEPFQSEEDRIFYGPGKPKKIAPPVRVERVRGKTSSNLNRILKNRGTLREALILKEILDTPVAMRE